MAGNHFVAQPARAAWWGPQVGAQAAAGQPVREVGPERRVSREHAGRAAGRSRRGAHAAATAMGRTLLFAVVAFSLTGLVGWRASQVARSGRQILQWKEEVRLLQADNRRLQAKVLELRSPQRIEAEAKARLGMGPPDMVRPVPLAALPASAGRVGATPAAPGVGETRTVVVALAPPVDANRSDRVGAQADLDPIDALKDLARAFSLRVADRSGS